MVKTTGLSPFEKRTYCWCSFRRAFDFEDGRPNWVLKSSHTSKVFKSWNQNPQSFSRRRNYGSSAVFKQHDRRHSRRIVHQNGDSTVVQLTHIVNHGSSRRRFPREPHEAMKPSCLTRTVQGFGGSIMLWSTFC